MTYLLTHFKRAILIPLLLLALFGALSLSTQPAHAVTRSVGPDYQACNPGWRYDNLTRYNNSLVPVGPGQSDYNGTGSNASATFSATASATINVTASGSVTVEGSVIVGSVKTTYGLTVSVAVTANLGNSFTITIPPYKTGNAQYGVWTVVTTGHYYYLDERCNNTWDDGYITTQSPLLVGWTSWLS